MAYSMLSKSDERTWATSNIVKCELGDTRVKLHQQGERLADTSTGSKNCDLSQLKAPRCQYVFYKGCSERWGLFFTCLAEAEKARRCTELKACLAANMMTDAEERFWAGKGRFERVNGLVMNLFSGEVAALGVCRRLVRGRVESFLSAPPMKSKEVALVLLLRSLGVQCIEQGKHSAVFKRCAGAVQYFIETSQRYNCTSASDNNNTRNLPVHVLKEGLLGIVLQPRNCRRHSVYTVC